MASMPIATDQADENLEAVLANYLRAAEEGRAPDRMELLARHPDLAPELAAFFAGQERFTRLAAPLRDAVSSAQESTIEDKLAEGGRLGDFRLLREVGRGGMGIVYEAEQISLGRKVALKILPFAGALDAKQLQRFKNEAHAAAHLQHQNIVPVYFVGCERGVHFYAMQFVEGQTLAALIQELRQASQKTPSPCPPGNLHIDPQPTGPYSADSKPPVIVDEDRPEAEQAAATIEDRGALMETVSAHPRSSILDSGSSFFRTVANLGIQAAEALEHAHQLGVIHRDIKPANLIIEPSPVTTDHSSLITHHSSLRLWITDFGLARLGTDAGLTMTGDLLGTLRYMSPEQALGNRVLVDHRTDIYSLGASLYELLTLEPVFSGHDRQDLLRQIAFEDPKPPRRFNKAIPPELETIVLKAVEKNPADRYATAQELADDLQRYLDDKAIRAKRPTPVQRFRKLARRHPGVARTATASAVLLLITAVLGLIISNSRIAREEKLTRDALDQVKDALNKANKQRDIAEANFRKACQAVDDQLTLVSQSKLLEEPGLQSLRKDLLESALKYYQDFLRERPNDPVLQIQVAAAYFRLYLIHKSIGGLSTNAIGALEKGVEIVEKLRREQPDDAKLYRRLAGFAKNSRDLHSVRGPIADPLVALAVFEHATKIWNQFVEKYRTEPGFQFDLSEFYVYTYELQLDALQPAEALASLRKCHAINEKLTRENPKVHEYRVALAFSHKHLGQSLSEDARAEEVEKHYRRYLELGQELADESPKVPLYRLMVADGYQYLGRRLMFSDRLKESEQAWRKALIVQQKLVTDLPYVPAYRGDLATIHSTMGILLRDTGRADKAEDAYRKAVDIWNKLAEDFPDRPEYRGEGLAFASFDLCVLLGASGRRQEAEQLYRNVVEFKPEEPYAQNNLAWLLANCPDSKFRDPKRALELAKKAVERLPNDGNIRNTLGVVYYRMGNWKDAVATLNKSMELRKGGDTYDWFFLALAHWQLGNKEQARQWYAKAVKGMDRPHDEGVRQEFRRFRAEAAGLQGFEEQPAPHEKEKPDTKGPSR